MSVYAWIADGTLIVGLGIAIGLIFGFDREVRGCREDVEALGQELAEVRGELALAKRSAQAMALRILQLSDDTGPIALDRPTPAQMAAPTRPDLTRQRPTPQPQQQPEPVHTGATAVGGPRHRATKKKSS